MQAPEPVIIRLPKPRQRRPDSAALRLEWRRFVHGLHLLRHWWLAPHTPYQPFFVIASARSGSNLLVDYLNQLSGVQCLSEILNWRSEIAPGQRTHSAGVIEHIRRSMQTLRTPYRGCKLFFTHLDDFRLTLTDLETSFPAAKYVVLYREALAEQFVSLKLALMTQQWLLLPGQEQKQIPVTIEPAELRKYCDTTRREYQELLGHLAIRERGAVLSYEELTENPARCLREQICSLLGVPAVAPKAVLCKQNRQPLADRVENYSAIAALAASSLCRQRYALPSQRFGRRKAA